jgi:hypothetical protein
MLVPIKTLRIPLCIGKLLGTDTVRNNYRNSWRAASLSAISLNFSSSSLALVG